MLLLALALAQEAAVNPNQPPSQTMMAEPVAMMIAAFDADGDARVTHAEMTAGVAKTYAAIDTAKAGSIGYIQFSQWAERYLGDANALPSPFEVDTNHDNRVTLAELDSQFDRTFARLDRDHDGVLTRAELLTIRAGPFDQGRRRR
ncbi:MAG TPA: EF-hand domain-containing protein [Sphingomonas sp.]|nr:EF-hand domain-containing protein [Sphingomonas sp.]